MNPKLLIIVLLSLELMAPARAVRLWSDAELERAADLIVIATPLATIDLNEINSLGFTSTATFHSRFRGEETTFRVRNVLKGMPENDRIVVHHYREELAWGSPPNGPTFVTFVSPTTNEWLLYLVKDGAKRYAPVTGQIDPYLSVKSATNLPMNFKFGFPLRPPIANADASIRYPVSVRVPTRLKILRTADTLAVETDTNSFESVIITVGTNMVTGVQSELFVYMEGEAKPANGGWGLASGLFFNLGVSYWHSHPDGIPLPGKKYIVETELTAFETDVPAQHMWDPQGGKYRALWRGTLKQTVE